MMMCHRFSVRLPKGVVMNYQVANAYYHVSINVIGGIETHLYYLAKKYQKYDITIFYHKCDIEQLKRLKKYVRCVQLRDDDVVDCDVLFYTYGTKKSVAEQFNAQKRYYIVHADYQDQINKGTLPPNSCDDNWNIDKYLSVSNVAKNGFKYDCETIYMPIEIDEYDDPIFLVSATRLTREKGAERMKRLIQVLDNAKVNYLWDIYTNSVNFSVSSPNVRVFKPRIDIVSKLRLYDAYVQLSDSEAYCVSMNEAMLCGLPIISTPIPLVTEINAKGVVIPFDMQDIDIEAIKNIKQIKVEYKPKKELWNKYLSHKETTYSFEQIKVRATNQYQVKHLMDKELGYIPKENEEWFVDADRYDELMAYERRTKNKLIEKVL